MSDFLRALFGRSTPADRTPSIEEAIIEDVRRGGGRIERVVLTRNRRVMASVTDRGRTLRLHEIFVQAPPHVRTALGILFSRSPASARTRARTEIRAFLESVGPLAPTSRSKPARRRISRPLPADRIHIARLEEEFTSVNEAFFGGRLPEVPIRLSGRMSRRNGHFMADPLEIAISRALCHRAVPGEAERTLRHEMIHLWQWVEGRKPGHGKDFRRWAARLDIHPRATRTVCWLEATG